MSQKIVIAQLGVKPYSETKYKNKRTGELIKTEYSFEAVMREAFQDEFIGENVISDARKSAKELTLILVGTKNSALGNLYEDISAGDGEDPNVIETVRNSDEEPQKGKKLGKTIKGLDDENSENRKKVVRAYEKCMSEKFTLLLRARVNVRLSIIEYGRDTAELENNFTAIEETVMDAVQSQPDDACGKGISANKERIDFYFDITYGFRSFPFYIYTLVNYLTRIQGYDVKFHMAYGMFEAKEDDGNGGKKTPLVDLQVIDDLMTLINAISEFQNSGSVIQVRQALAAHKEWNIQIGDEGKETLSYAFELFDYATNVNNLAPMEEALALLKGMKERLKEVTNISQAEKALLEGISENLCNQFDAGNGKLPYTRLMVQLADWYHRQGREGSAAIAVSESVITYLFEKYPDEVAAYLKAYPDTCKRRCLPSDMSTSEYLFNHTCRDAVKKELINKINGRLEYYKSISPDAKVRASVSVRAKTLADIAKFFDRHDYFAKFIDAFTYVRDNIRNVMAHNAYEQVIYDANLGKNEQVTDKYRQNIGTLIECMRNELQPSLESCKGQGIGEVLIHEMAKTTRSNQDEINKQKAEKERIKPFKALLDALKNQGEYTGKIDGDETLQRNIQMLVKQVKTVRSCGEKFEVYYSKRKDLGLWFALVNYKITHRESTEGVEWSTKKFSSADIYREEFKRKKSKSSGDWHFGWWRTLDFFSRTDSRVSAFARILEEY